MKINLYEGEEKIALDFVAGKINLTTGEGLVESFSEAYPGNNLSPNQKKYKAKQILKRERVQAFIEQVKNSGGISSQITEEWCKRYLYETANENKGKRIGLDAALALGKEFGIGTQQITIKDERRYDLMLEQLHEYNDARARGENPQVPQILTDFKPDAIDVEFEVIEGEIEDE